MCGIVGYVAERPVAPDLIASLARLEYRGYDSAGLCLADPGFLVRKVVGRAADLDLSLLPGERGGACGIAHTRWATHGKPEARNAHPHTHAGIAVVHNGIIENHAELRAELRALGHEFLSDTDSEVVPHLIARARAAGLPARAALAEACSRLHGAFALGVVFADFPGRILVARRGSPLMVGQGETLAAIASDPLALAGTCGRFAALEDGDIAELGARDVRIFGADGGRVARVWQTMIADIDVDGLEDFAHHTRREIAEQPAALRRTLAALENIAVPARISAATRLIMVACGSSHYAASVARPAIERLAGIPCDLEIASEFRYRDPIVPQGAVAVLVSQSGETADTLAALDLFRARGVPVVAVVNVAHSAMARGADLLWPTSAGREQGVAATKSFTTQLAAMIRLAVALGEARGIKPASLRQALAELDRAAVAAREAEQLEPALADLAHRLAAENEALFVGRGASAALAAEASLKLKELSYIRAESYPAGELKHGPIALLREGSPALVLAQSDGLLPKTAASAEEMRARGAWVVALADEAGATAFRHAADRVVTLPGEGLAWLFAASVALQLIAYHAAVALARDVDRPRNLAKSVTVE